MGSTGKAPSESIASRAPKSPVPVGLKNAAPDGLNAAGNGLGREQVAEIQRARIMAAMVEVASEHGAANVTVAHVVARSGVSRRTFYDLFDDCEDCFLAAFDQAIQRITAVVVPAYEESGTWRVRIRAALIALLEFLEDEPGMGRLLIVETLAAGPDALERRQSVLAQVLAVVDDGRNAGRRGDGPSPLTGEGVVGGVLSVLHARLLKDNPGSLLELTGPLTSMIVLPYLGSSAAQKELQRPVPERHSPPHHAPADPLRGVGMRLTYRTVRVLTAIAEHPRSSNREIGIASGMQDQGQISKLLTRLHRLGLVHNTGAGPTKGAPNAWTLTPKGQDIQAAIGH
ncbi:MAG: TetR/AcrR family transcriptional regulator [Solirubrobacteraceae bacterium]